MNRPNLVVFGAQKSGTTWLHNRLGRHAQTFMSGKKELDYFSGKDSDHDPAALQAYFDHFQTANGQLVRGESSPNYLWVDDARLPERRNIPTHLRSVLGKDVRLIAVLRNPVARAVSAFFHHYRMGRIAPGTSILQALNQRLGIGTMGEYDRQLTVWMDVFPPESFLFLCFDDIPARPQALLDGVCVWLGLDPGQMPAPDARSKSDNPGGSMQLREDGIYMSNVEAALLSKKEGREIMRDHPPMVTHAEITQLETYYEASYAFVASKLGFDAWAGGFDAERFVMSRQ